MPSPDSEVTSADGSLDWSGGVDSLAVTTLKSQANPNGLDRSQLAWLINATVRDGGISPRSGWRKNGNIMPGNGLYQGSAMYNPLGANPYIIASIGGQIFQIDATNGTVVNLSAQFNCFNPPTQPKAYFQQAEQFLIIQAGDNVTLPLFWDGALLRRSQGLTSATQVPATVTILNVADNTHVGQTIPAGSVLIPGLTITNYKSFVMPIVGGSVTVQCTSTVTNLPSALFTIPLRTTVTIKNPGGGGHTAGATVLAGSVSVGGPNGFTMTNFDSFVVPALGATVQVKCDGISFAINPPTFPTAVFQLALAGGGQSQFLEITAAVQNTTGNLQVTAFTAASTIAGNVELPPATAMDYYMGRLWYAQGRNYCAGDIVGGPSGTVAYNFTDSVLKVTENPLVVGGDGFTVPSDAGNITAIFHSANLNAALGQGQLFISTAKSIYSLNVPVTRLDWINANSQNEPLQVVVQIANGAVNDWSVTPVNGDNFFQSLEPAVRSLQQAVRYFGQWGNAQISSEVNRILQFTNRALLPWSSGAYFDNRLLQTALPVQTPQGVVSSQMVIIDFMPISSFGITTQSGTIANPVWEGSYEGLKILQLLTGIFGGVERCFAISVSDTDSSFEVWEFVIGLRTDNGDNRITLQAEFPAFTWGTEFGMKELVGGELWIDRLWGTVEFTMEYRRDGETCWNFWHKWKECSSRSSAEDCPPTTYPLTPHGVGYRQTMTLPKPPTGPCDSQSGRPTTIGYQFQTRLTVHGFCRVRGLLLHAKAFERKLYESPVC